LIFAINPANPSRLSSAMVGKIPSPLPIDECHTFLLTRRRPWLTLWLYGQRGSGVIGVLAADRKKYEQVVLFFLKHFNNATMGRTKLVKLLYFLDFGFYEKHGRSITGDVYVKYPHGPMPGEIETVIKGMTKRRLVKPRRARFHGKSQHRLEPLAAPDMSVFTRKEVEALEQIGKEFEGSTAKDVEEISHHETPWLVADDGDYVSYEFATMRSPNHLHEALELKALAKRLSATELIENSGELMESLRKAKRSSSKSRALTHDEVFS
jgi:uncharacterized phage-associated protein